MLKAQRARKGMTTVTVLRLASLALAVVSLAVFLLPGAAPAAGEPQAAPVNPQYLQWKGEDTTAVSGKASSFPSSYDLRDYGRVTPVRDQGDCDGSWAFGSMAALESAMLPGTQTDFSEGHLLDRHGFNFAPCSGGTLFMALAYLSRWGGPVPESQYPYPYLKAAKSLPSTNSSASTKSFHVQDMNWFPTTPDNVKSALVTAGAVAVPFYYSSSFYNSSTYGYYCDTSRELNHVIAIIGWDDNYSKSKFNIEPAGDGAYLVKNSWGTDWGNNGYFWISYYDKSLSSSASFKRAESAANYNWIYQYDPLGMTTWAGWDVETSWMANVFKANPLGSTIKAVAFYAAVDNTGYTIYIYNNLKITKDKNHMPVVQPRSGTRILAQKGTVTGGYHTIKLNKVVKVSAGKNFSVVLKVTTPGYGYPLAFEWPQAGLSTRATAIPGQSYVSYDGTEWADLPKYDFWKNSNACLKAFGSQ